MSVGLVTPKWLLESWWRWDCVCTDFGQHFDRSLASSTAPARHDRQAAMIKNFYILFLNI
jgi:hypothetical protein